MSKVDSFYDATNSLLDMKTLKKDPKLYENQFQLLLGTTRWVGEGTLKIMASNFIPHYVQFFPNLKEQALNCQLDFCEDDDPKVRKEAIKALHTFSKNVPQYASRVADVLIQLLQTESQEELQVVRDTLLLSFQHFAKDSFHASFHQLASGSELVKNGIARFMIQVLFPTLSNPVKMEYLAKCISTMEQSFGIREVEIVMHLLESADRNGQMDYNAKLHQLYLKLGNGILDLRVTNGKQKISRLAYFYTFLFQSGVSSGPFLLFLLTKVLDPATPIVESRQQLEMLQYVASNIRYCTNFEVISELIPTLERLLIIFSNDLSPSNTTVTLSLLKIEPVLYCVLYYRVKIPNANRDNSLAFQSALTVCLQTTQQTIHLANQSKNLPAAQLHVILKSTETSLVICKDLLKGKNIKNGNALKMSWVPEPVVPKAAQVVQKVVQKGVQKVVQKGVQKAATKPVQKVQKPVQKQVQKVIQKPAPTTKQVQKPVTQRPVPKQLPTKEKLKQVKQPAKVSKKEIVRIVTRVPAVKPVVVPKSSKPVNAAKQPAPVKKLSQAEQKKEMVLRMLETDPDSVIVLQNRKKAKNQGQTKVNLQVPKSDLRHKIAKAARV